MMSDVNEVKYARIAEAAFEVKRACVQSSGEPWLKSWWELPQQRRLDYTSTVRGLVKGEKAPQAEEACDAVFRAAVVQSARLLGMEISA
jgi:hypothetical protein